MPYPKVLLTLVFFFLVPFAVKADQWQDPSWREMIDSSEVIALVKYTSGGGFRAQAQILNLYKGSLAKGEALWITGFSGRYGPYDSVKAGDTYLVFLNQIRPTDRDLRYWDEQLKETPELGDYIHAMKAGKVYDIWTPTAGDLKVKGSRVQYDLLQTSTYDEQPYYSLPDFETFLRLAISGQSNESFYQKKLTQLFNRNTGIQVAQHLMMLYLTKYNRFHSNFEKIRLHKDPAVRFALALLMGNIKTHASRDLLVALLNDKNSLVQGEVVRQLASEPVDFIGPLLVKKLKTAGKGVAGASNIMDPVTNTINGGQVEIIETLRRLKYTPVIPQLVPLLETTDNYLFKLIVETLKELGSTAYVPYLKKHLSQQTSTLIFRITQYIVEDSIYECVPALMQYVTTHDRSDFMSKEYTINAHIGLGHFQTDTVRKFLVNDFKKLLRTDIKNTVSIDTKRKWVEEYAGTFIDLGIDTLKSYFYDFLYAYYGINYQFKTNPQLFAFKKLLEDSLVSVAVAALPKDSIRSVKAIAFITLDSLQRPTLKDYLIKYDALEGVRFDNLNPLLMRKGISEKHLIASSGSYSMLYANRVVTEFDGLFKKVLNYIVSFPDAADIQFIENLQQYGYPEDDYDKRWLHKFVETARSKVQ